MSIPAQGKPFGMSFKNHPHYKADAMIIGIDNDPVNSDRKYRVSLINRQSRDAAGHVYSLPDSIVEVEAKWFDRETGRIITPM